MSWLACVLIGAGLTAVAWLAATYPWRKPKPMPPLVRRIPGRPVDGELTDGEQREWDDIEGRYCLMAPDVVYKRQRDEERP